jgi:hypothetical protein
MSNFKLGEKERYDIDDEIIKKYNIKEGTISPFTRLKVIDIENDKEEIDIKKPTVDTGIDIKKVSSKEEIDIKKVLPLSN